VVDRIITDLAVIDVAGTPEQPRLVLVETAPGVDAAQVREATGVELEDPVDG
jgi:3-oxoacid CoA-transferase subunit B